MSRRRMIDPDFWVDDKIAQLDMVTRLVFISTWMYADDEGYYEENYERMRASLFPYDSRFNIQKHIDVLINTGRIEVFSGTEGKKYHKIANFTKYQTISHPTPSEIKKISGTFGSPPENSPQVKLSKVKLSKVKLSKVNEKLSKDRYLDFVYLSQEEYKKLVDLFGEQGTKDRIDNLNLYALKIGEKKFNAKYSSHYAVILTWEKKNNGRTEKTNSKHIEAAAGKYDGIEER